MASCHFSFLVRKKWKLKGQFDIQPCILDITWCHCRLLLRRTLDMKLVIDFIRLDVVDSTIGWCGFHNVEIKPGELVSLGGSPSTYSIEWSSVRLNSGIISSTHSGGTRLVLLESFWIVSWVIKLVILLESLWINVKLVIILVCIVLLQSINIILVLLE